jgi:hypothetical protein
MRTRLIPLFITLVMISAMFSCSSKFSDVYYADGDSAATNMLVFSGDTGNLLTKGLSNTSTNTVVSISMGVTAKGTYTVSGNTLTFIFDGVTSTATYDKTNDAITWYGVTYIKPVPETTTGSVYN